jgi:glycosyltransferase involved in cell wall biosynthesis
MKISVFGMSPFSNLIKEGFTKLGHEISDENPELIYANDPRGYKEAIQIKKKNKEAPLIFNLLDIPWHMPNIQQQTKLLVNQFLNQADFVSVISLKVKKDLSQFFNKKIHIIYNPIKDVYYDEKILKNNMFLFVGRANDPIKRFDLVRDTLIKIKDGIKKIKVCGAENPNFGNYLGYVSDEELNNLYNSTQFVLLPSKAEGIGLPMIESMICGALPITCSDNEAAKEFLPRDFICAPDPKSILEHIKKLENEYANKRNLAFEFGKRYKEKFNKSSIAKNILNILK